MIAPQELPQHIDTIAIVSPATESETAAMIAHAADEFDRIVSRVERKRGRASAKKLG